ncbi:IQ motif and SEC7 domain-containing protein 1 isoform X1 [Culex pipiens pallens]|uniref:IQ motif and SEC7 domain-containing protein 1 isoform X1 n=1 Tax=Culex pipiens pallens TaxID=42434 RepID=UPI001953E88B|nr:IQ motif and SEC7 domain-containing protein 1 isoform X1 [Culex pipiens pallens]XP_052564693.1 IQ motif and SEC7 domain-containing protein 1 isoform X1 [Culex pipiens pallens]
MLDPELYGGSGVDHHHFKNHHHRHYHGGIAVGGGHHHHRHTPSASSSGDRKSSSRSSPRSHFHQHGEGEKLRYQNAFSSGGSGASGEGYFRYYPHQHSSYYDLSEKLDSLNLKSEGEGGERRRNDSNNNHNHGHSHGHNHSRSAERSSVSVSVSNGSSEHGGGGGSSRTSDGSGSKKKTTVVYVGDGRSRVRRVVRTQTRHITVVSYSGRKRESETHTQHHATVLSFPQKIDRPSQIYSTHHHHPGSGSGILSASGASTSSNASSSLCGGSAAAAVVANNGTGGYVYLPQTTTQQHYVQPQQLAYHHHHQPNSYHHSQLGGGHQTAMATPTLHKKGSIRSNGEVLKRTRGQNAYELSQDLLDKQIELLERKYGGVKARHAALTIQRAFRHYTMVKKFASITAMAKAEKRMSRRVQHQQHQAELEMMQQQQGHLAEEGQLYEDGSLVGGAGGVGGGQRVCATISATPPGTLHHRVTPVRSMSLRERRLDSSPIPRSQSGNASPAPPATASANSSWTQGQMCTTVPSSGGGQQQQPYSHPHVNILHQQQQAQAYYAAAGGQGQILPSTYQSSQYGSQDLNVSGGSSVLDSTISSMNLSWNSTGGQPIVATAGGLPHGHCPYTPHYTAAQIYMRPRGIGIGSSGGSSGSAASSCSASRKVPPEVPKRTSSITSAQHTPNRSLRPNGLCKTAENGSLSSVQSSGSDSSASAERMQGVEIGSDRSSSPQWKRKGPGSSSGSASGIQINAQSPDHLIGATVTAGVVGSAGSANVTISSIENECLSSHTSAAQYSMEQHDQIVHTPTSYKVSETIRKRQYRVGLNLFNKKPERGITYLIRKGFLENTPQGVARFLISRKGLSRQMIGEYLGNLQNPFNMAVLDCFAGELDLSGMQVDVALRKFQGYFRMPGEAQKIERLMEVFSTRYCQCNSDIVARLRSHDTVFVLAFAIIMLNTDLHTPNLKPERRMRADDFIKNLRGIDDCGDIDRDMLTGIYERVKANEFKPGSDHVTQVMKVQATIVGKKPNLALPHRRLVCYCRLYEIPDINKKERPGVHQREVFLFNDLLVITKIFSKKKSSVTYTFRNSYPLCGMVVTLLDVPNYPYCIRLSQKVDGKVLVTFNARNEHDRCKFAEDLRESISEMDEMETLRIEAELERQKSARGGQRSTNSENRDSGVADVEVGQFHPSAGGGGLQGSGSVGVGGVGGGGVSPSDCGIAHTHSEAQLKRSALSNSLLDMHEQFGNEKPQRRGSVGSLDSGMSISFQSTSASTGSRSDIKVNRMLSHSNTSGQIIMHAGQHPTALMGAIYHQQILQQHPQHPQPPPTQPVVMTTQPPPPQNVVVTQPPQQLATGAIRRERKLSRPEEGATMAAAAAASAPGSGANYGRSTEV